MSQIEGCFPNRCLHVARKPDEFGGSPHGWNLGSKTSWRQARASEGTSAGFHVSGTVSSAIHINLAILPLSLMG